MANYALVANSVFQPFTYQELAAPLDRQELYHEKLAEEYDQLSAQADLLEVLGKNDRDKVSGAYGRYKSYSDALRNEADNLYMHGLNTESRQRLSDLKRRYNTDIRPIQNAWNKREEETKMQMNASMSNPSIRFTRSAGDTPIDYYVDNPMGGYGVVNLEAIKAQMSEMAKNLAKQKREGRKEGIDAYTYQFINPYGLDPNLINDWMKNPEVSPTLTNMMNQILESNGLNTEEFLHTPNGAKIAQEAVGAAQRGAWSAVGEDRTEKIENYGARLNAQAAKEIGVYRSKLRAAREDQAANAPQTTHAVINPSNIYSAEESVEQNKNIKKYSQYFTTDKNGRTVLNEEGIKEYSRNTTPRVNTSSSGGGTARLMNAETNLENYNKPFTPTAFRTFIDELGGKDLVTKKQYGNLGNLWNQYKQRDYLKYDASALTEYNHNIDPSEYTNWKDRILERANGNLERVKWDKKKKEWVSDGKVPVTEAFKDNGNPVSTQSSSYGRTFRVVDKNGNAVRYRLPRGINSRAEQNIENHLRALDVVHGLYNQMDRNGIKVLTVEEAGLLNQSIGRNVFTPGTVINYPTLQAVSTSLEDALATFESQLGMTNTNKPQEWSAMSFGNNLGSGFLVDPDEE